jgi:long-subunit fatty acid transport protein
MFNTMKPAAWRLMIPVLGMVMMIGVTSPAQAQVGGAAVVFLQIEPDSRAAGMGNAGVALADNASAIFWNPAGLAFQRGTELALTHSNWLPEFNAGLFYEYLVGRHHIPGWGTVGAHITFLNLGEHEWRDAQNIERGTFRSYDLAVGGSYGFNVTDRLALGTGLRLVYSNLAPGVEVDNQPTKAGVAVGVDLSALYRTAPFTLGGIESQASFGANLANMGPRIQYSDGEQSDPIPTNLRFGWAYTMNFDDYNSLTLTNDFTKMLVRVRIDSTETGRVARPDPFYQAIFTSWAPIDVRVNAMNDPNAEMRQLGPLQQLTIGTGVEYWYDRLFALRAGYFYENPYNGNRQFLTFGAGIRYNIVGVDFSYIYALEENHPLSDTMRFSLLLNLGR